MTEGDILGEISRPRGSEISLLGKGKHERIHDGRLLSRLYTPHRLLRIETLIARSEGALEADTRLSNEFRRHDGLLG